MEVEGVGLIIFEDFSARTELLEYGKKENLNGKMIINWIIERGIILMF